jgi:hypothetical protein
LSTLIVIIEGYSVCKTIDNPFFSNKREKTMKEIVTTFKGWMDDLGHLMLSFVAIGAVSEVIFGSGIFGVNVIGNLTSIINSFGESGFAGLVALLVLVGLFRK